MYWVKEFFIIILGTFIGGDDRRGNRRGGRRYRGAEVRAQTAEVHTAADVAPEKVEKPYHGKPREEEPKKVEKTAFVMNDEDFPVLK